MSNTAQKIEAQGYTPGQLVKFKDDGHKAEVLATYKNGNLKLRYQHDFFGERIGVFPASVVASRTIKGV